MALVELDLRPVTSPELDVVSFGESEPFVFSATFSTLPRVTLPESSGLEITVPPNRPVSESDVEAALEEVQAQFGVLGEAEGDSVSDGDLVRVKEGEQEWDTRALSDNPITKHLVGAAVGSTVDIDTEVEEGKPLKTQLEIVGLRQMILPEINDELAVDAGYDNLEALKSDIREKLAERRSDAYEQRVHAALLEALLEKTEIPLPEPFVDELVDEEVERLRKSMDRPESRHTFSEYLEEAERTEEDLRGEIRTSMEGRVRRELVLKQLAEDLEIAIDDEELGRLAEQDAKTYDQDPVRFTASLKAEDRWEEYRRDKINERIFATLTETAKITEKEES
jgi:trigger factor